MLRTPASLSGFPSSTWAGLPAAASASGLIFRVTDYGVAGVGLLMLSDGVRWNPLGPQLLARSAVAASVTGTVTETALATVTVPAGAMGLNGGLHVYSTWTLTNSANNKTIRKRLGGITGSQVMSQVLTATTAVHDLRRLTNRNSASAQMASAYFGTGLVFGGVGTAASALAVNTALAQDLVLSGQLASAAETITLESYEAWLLP